MDAARTRQFSLPIMAASAACIVAALIISDRDTLAVTAIVGWAATAVEACVIRGLCRELQWRGR